MRFSKNPTLTLILVTTTWCESIQMAHWLLTDPESKEYSFHQFLEYPEDQFGEHDVYHIKETSPGLAVSCSFNTFYRTQWNPELPAKRYHDPKYWSGNYLNSTGYPVYEQGEWNYKSSSGWPYYRRNNTITVGQLNAICTFDETSSNNTYVVSYRLSSAGTLLSSEEKIINRQTGKVVYSGNASLHVEVFDIDTSPIDHSFPDGETFWRKYGEAFASCDEHMQYVAVRNAIESLQQFGPNVYETLGGATSLSALATEAKNCAGLFSQALANSGSVFGLVPAAKLSGNLYLKKQFEVDPSITDYGDLRKMLKLLKRLIKQWETTQYGVYSSNGKTVRAAVHCTPLDNGLYWDDLLGITPSPSNLWAIIPFSFMVDWFLHGGDNLAEIEFAAKYGSDFWNISHVTYSVTEILQKTIDEPGWTVIANPVIKKYSRYTRRSLPAYEYERPEDTQWNHNHVLETGAICLNSF